MLDFGVQASTGFTDTDASTEDEGCRECPPICVWQRFSIGWVRGEPLCQEWLCGQGFKMSCLVSWELHVHLSVAEAGGVLEQRSPLVCCPQSPFLLEHAFLAHRVGGSVCRARVEHGRVSKPDNQDTYWDSLK